MFKVIVNGNHVPEPPVPKPVLILIYNLQSDFGAPLMCSDDNGIWKLHGILSREGECVDPNSNAITRAHPDVFTDIQALTPWIEQIVGSPSQENVS